MLTSVRRLFVIYEESQAPGGETHTGAGFAST